MSSSTITALREKIAAELREKASAGAAVSNPTPDYTVADSLVPPTARKSASEWPDLLPTEGVPYSKLFPEYMPDGAADFGVPVFFDYDFPAWVKQYVPKNIHYVAPAALIYNAVMAYVRKSVTHVVGPPGTGKSEGLPNLIAERLGLPVFRFALNKKGMMFDDLVGRESIVAQDGQSVTAHKDGLLVKAIEHPCIALLDEFSRANGEIVSGCMSLMERGGKLIVENRSEPVIMRHADCWVVASDNVKGLGDGADRMVGTELVDAAILDRFDVTLEVGYLDVASTTALVKTWVPGIPHADKLAKFATLVQQAYAKGNLPLTLSPRGIRAIAEYACIHKGYAPAVKLVYLCKLSEESDVECVKECYRTAFGKALDS